MSVISIPDELFQLIYSFLSFADATAFYSTRRNNPKLYIPYKIYPYQCNWFKYDEIKGVMPASTATSYLLTNTNDELNCSHIQNNYVEIVLRRGSHVLNFLIYKDVYDPRKDILDYLETLEPKYTRKFSYKPIS